MKTEVYSWRITPRLKSDLESAARNEKLSVAQLLERITQEWLTRSPGQGTEADEEQRIRAAVQPWIGSFASGETDRAANVRTLLRERLANKARRRP